MSELLGPPGVARPPQRPFLGLQAQYGREHSEELVREVDREVRRIPDEAHRRAEEVLRTGRHV